MTDGPDLTGTALVAGPGLADPNFARSVVLVLRHDDDGALGLILDRPSDVPVADHLPGWVEPLARPGVVFVGGPVQREAAIGLGRLAAGADPPPGWEPMALGLGLVDLGSPPGESVGALAALRVYSGYAGWSRGQLDLEAATGDWIVVPVTGDDPFGDDPGTLRRRLLRRAGGAAAFYADAPADPGLN